MFRLNLATSPDLKGRKLGVELATPYFQGSAPLPPAGMTSIEHFELPADATFDLEVHFQIDGNSVGATIHRLCDGDVFSVFAAARGPSAVEGRGVLYPCNVGHAGAKVEHCKVQCADGTEGECCVTCRDESGNSETKICC